MTAENRMCILLVDDEPINLFAVHSLLRRDFTVITASNGNHALKILKEHSVDVVLSDQLMPEMTGVALLSKVKELKPNIKRYILTAYCDNEELKRGMDEQVVEHIFEKPFHKAELNTVINRDF
jgi:two-component system response regulator HupR/HoxA